MYTQIITDHFPVKKLNINIGNLVCTVQLKFSISLKFSETRQILPDFPSVIPSVLNTINNDLREGNNFNSLYNILTDLIYR
jgi:hypothetical protein